MSKRISALVCSLVLVASFAFSACSTESSSASSEPSGFNSESSTNDVSFDVSAEDSSVASGGDSSEESETESNLSKYAEAYERDRRIYTDYLLKINYEGLYIIDDINDEEAKIASYMVDLDNDGNYELLLDIFGHDGARHSMMSALLIIREGKVKTVVTAENWGGSMGGDELYLVTDTKNDCLAVKMASLFRSGTSSSYYHEFYTLDTKFETPEPDSTLALFYDKLSGDYTEEIEKIKRETNLYTENDEYFDVYMIDDKYVSKKDWSNVEERFINIDHTEYMPYETTFEEPIVSWEER